MKNRPFQEQIVKCHEVELHYKRPLFESMEHVKSFDDADAILRKYINPKQMDLMESFYVILLTSSHRLLGISCIAIGAITGVVTNMHAICQMVILSNSSSLIVAHTHPSGNLKPSKSDIETTKKIKALMDILNVNFLDHIILSSEGSYSMSQNFDM